MYYLPIKQTSEVCKTQLIISPPPPMKVQGNSLIATSQKKNVQALMGRFKHF